MQQANRLSIRRFTVRIRALCFRMPFVFLEHIAIGLNTRDIAPAVMALGRDAIRVTAVLVDPFEFGPAFGI